MTRHPAFPLPQVKYDLDRAFLRETVAACFLSLSVPVRWKRALQLSNKMVLRRWLRICMRHLFLYTIIHSLRCETLF